MLRYLLIDVVEYDLQKIRDLFDSTIEGFIIFSENQFKQVIKQDSLLPDDYGPKEIILVLTKPNEHSF